MAPLKRTPTNKKKRTPRKSRKPLMPIVWAPSPFVTQILSGIAITMVLGGAGLWMYLWVNNPENMQVTKIDWQGRFDYVTREELQLTVEPLIQTNLYLLDSTRLETALDEHPWVRSVSLHKAWPQQIIIRVEEQFPVAFWGEDHLLNKFGEIFPGTLTEKKGIFPLLYSPDKKGREMGERYVSLMKNLQGLNLEIVELTEDERGSWSIRFREGPIVVVGRRDQKKRIKRFIVGYAQSLKARFADIERIDLRYTNGFAVKWKRGAAVGQLPEHPGQFLRVLWS